MSRICSHVYYILYYLAYYLYIVGLIPGLRHLFVPHPLHEIVSIYMAVLIWYTVYQWAGGAIFSRSFCVATSLFESATDKAAAATVMNVIYFAGLVGVSVAVLLIKW